MASRFLNHRGKLGSCRQRVLGTEIRDKGATVLRLRLNRVLRLRGLTLEPRPCRSTPKPWHPEFSTDNRRREPSDVMLNLMAGSVGQPMQTLSRCVNSRQVLPAYVPGETEDLRQNRFLNHSTPQLIRRLPEPSG